jgi:plasmid stabilization system protein ParE
MSLRIVWSESSLNDYSQCILYLEEDFSDKEINVFISEVNRVLNIIIEIPSAFPLSEYKNLRYAVVIKQITIFYKVNNRKENIEIVRMWNNRKNKTLKRLK